MSHNERTFIYSSLDTIGEKHLASLPTLFQTNGVNVLVTESDIEDYPGMWIRGAGSGKISGSGPSIRKVKSLNPTETCMSQVPKIILQKQKEQDYSHGEFL